MKMNITAADRWAVAAAIWLVLVCAFAVIMAKAMQNIFFAMYSDATYPWPTVVFLHADRWGFIAPLLPGIPTYLAWSRGTLEKHLVCAVFWMLVVASLVLLVVAIGIVMPFATTTFHMGR
jgi:hypothetical protein